MVISYVCVYTYIVLFHYGNEGNRQFLFPGRRCRLIKYPFSVLLDMRNENHFLICQ